MTTRAIQKAAGVWRVYREEERGGVHVSTYVGVVEEPKEGMFYVRHVVEHRWPFAEPMLGEPIPVVFSSVEQAAEALARRCAS